MSPDPDRTALGSALVAELAKKTGVCWLRPVPAHASGQPGRWHAVWHAWADDALCLVSGGTEQPVPELEDGGRVEVVMRSKDNGGRLLTWVGTATVVPPGSERWGPVTGALVAGRLNAPDLATTAEGWARTSVVHRVVPTGELVEAPGDLSDTDHRATPVGSPATTRGPLPRILHRRVTRRPRLS